MTIHLVHRLARGIAAAVIAAPLLATAAAAQSPTDFLNNLLRPDAGRTDEQNRDNRDYRDNRDTDRARRDDDRDRRREPGIVLYGRDRFGGRSVPVEHEVSDLNQVNFNDRTGSIRVNWGVWEVCEHANFGGRCTVIDRSVGDVRSMGLEREISSVRPVERRGARRR